MNEHISMKRKVRDLILDFLVHMAALVIIALILLMTGYILFRGIPNITAWSRKR